MVKKEDKGEIAIEATAIEPEPESTIEPEEKPKRKTAPRPEKAAYYENLFRGSK